MATKTKINQESSDQQIDRNVLPIADKAHHGTVKFAAPKGAPNVLINLIDDVGFGASSAFGEPCSTPTAERLGTNYVFQ